VTIWSRMDQKVGSSVTAWTGMDQKVGSPVTTSNCMEEKCASDNMEVEWNRTLMGP